MAHKKFIDSVMKHCQVTIKDLDEFLQYHRNRSLQRDAGHTSHHHEKK